MDDLCPLLTKVPRNYQVEVYTNSVNYVNSVIYMRTGTGKTLCAFMRMLAAKLITHKPALLVAPTRALVHQHKKAWLTDVKNKRNVGIFLGESPPPTSISQFKQFQAVFATPGWVNDRLLKSSDVSMSKLAECFSLIVVDEVHHMRHQTPAAQFILEWDSAGQPLPLLGLSASPIEPKKYNEIEFDLAEFLYSVNAVVVEPYDFLDEYYSHVNNTALETRVVSPKPLPWPCVMALIDQSISDLRHVIQSHRSFVTGNLLDFSQSQVESCLSSEVIDLFKQLIQLLTTLSEMVNTSSTKPPTQKVC
ncbi:hypothetical protein GEMRC1_011874 [Eukaryota sp. GEM-RC1]